MLEMMPQLQPIIDKLKSDQFFAVTIANADTIKNICTNKSGAKMIEESGSVEGYFNEIVVNQGNPNIVIQPRRKNGSSFKDSGDLVTVRTTAEKKVYQAQIDFQPSPTQPPAPSHAPDMMSFPALMGGLNAMDVAYNFRRYPEVQADNERLKAENENLKEKIAELKEKALEAKFSEDKAAGNSQMLSGIMEHAPAILAAFANLKGGNVAPATGLGTPLPEDLTPTKTQLIQLVKSNSDNVLFYILHTLNGINSNEAFGADLIEIIQKHNLIPV